jgi:uroporphyrinogen decarboxylase
MTHRERVLTALRHEEPDRVPLDLGGSQETTISAVAYRRLRAHLGLAVHGIRVDDPCQHTAVVDEDVREMFDLDVVPVFPRPRAWRIGTLPDGSAAEFPARFTPERLEDGSQVTRDASGNVLLRMPADGHYFDPVYSPLAGATGLGDIDKHLDSITSYDTPGYLDAGYQDLGEHARRLRAGTDCFLLGHFGGHIFQAGQSLRGWDTFLGDLLINRKFAEALMDRLAEANVARFARFAATVGPHVDGVIFEDDLGAQDRPLLAPDLYRRVVKPYHRRLYEFAKSVCPAYRVLHTDGAVGPFIPDFIEMGIDVLNPVQPSAAGMDTKVLKREFGSSISFWGGGCDTQHVLPTGTPGEVADEVKRRIDDLAPGGGFVFAAVHNVLSDVPPENVAAMFRTARQYGTYGNRRLPPGAS